MRVLILILAACSAWGQAWYPSLPEGWSSSSSITSSTIDSTGEKFAMCGSLWTPNQGTKSIRKAAFRFGGAITKASGSALTVSLQDVSTSAGPPIQPDGTQDQTVAISNAAIPAVNSFYLTGVFSSDRSVAFGGQLCVVVEFDGAGRLGSDSITFGSVSRNSGNPTTYPNVVLNTGSWASVARVPIVVFEFSDGTYGTLDGAYVFSAYNTTAAYNSGSATDEYALKFTVPTNGTLTGVALGVTTAASADFDIVLYSGTTSLASVSIDYNTWDALVSSVGYVAFPPTALTTGTTYYLSVKPTTANNVTIGGYTVGNNAYLGAMPDGTGYIRSGRVDGGSWSDTNTVLPNIRFRFTPSVSGSSASGAYVVAQ